MSSSTVTRPMTTKEQRELARRVRHALDMLGSDRRVDDLLDAAVACATREERHHRSTRERRELSCRDTATLIVGRMFFADEQPTSIAALAGFRADLRDAAMARALVEPVALRKAYERLEAFPALSDARFLLGKLTKVPGQSTDALEAVQRWSYSRDVAGMSFDE